MASEVVTIGDYVAQVLTELVKGETVDDPPLAKVQRVWESTHDLEKVTGKHIDVYSTSYADVGPVTRAEDFYDVGVVIVMLERYTGNLTTPEEQSRLPHVPNSWIDANVEFVETNIFNPMNKVGETVLPLVDNPLRLGKWWTENIVVTTVCDPDLIRQFKVFWSEIELTFRKLKG